jgi:hypothetical protein
MGLDNDERTRAFYRIILTFYPYITGQRSPEQDLHLQIRRQHPAFDSSAIIGQVFHQLSGKRPHLRIAL